MRKNQTLSHYGPAGILLLGSMGAAQAAEPPLRSQGIHHTGPRRPGGRRK